MIMKLCRRKLLVTTAVCLLLSFSSKAQQFFVVPKSWKPTALGPGGQVTGIDIAPDGTRVCKTDVGGAYFFDTTLNKWRQVITVGTGMPFGGAWEIRVAPSNPSRVYLVNGSSVYRNDAKGVGTWTLTSFPALVGNSCNSGSATASNGANKFTNQKLAVDPNNQDVVYFATNNNGVQVSFDAGATAAAVSGVTASTTGPGGAGLCFDASSGTVTVGGQTRTKIIYIPSYGNGVWQSTDGGVTWAQIGAGTGPTTVRTAQIDSNGVYFCADGTKTWMWTSTGTTPNNTWVEMKPSGSSFAAQAVCIDPNTPGRLIVSGPSGANFGTEAVNAYINSWHGTWNANFPTGHPLAYSSPSIPWLAVSGTFLTLGDMVIDKTTGLVHAAIGVGTCHTNWPLTFTAFGWTDDSLGIEELVVQDIIAPVGGPVMYAVEDRGVFTLADPSVFQSTYFPNTSFHAGWALDYASNDSTFIAALINNDIGSFPSNQYSASSSNSGATWALLSGIPAAPGLGGCIAAASHTNMVFLGGNNTLPYYTLDGGATWTLCPGLPGTGWIASLFTGAFPVAADRVNIGTFYLYNTISGLYRSTDGGQTWVNILSSIFPNALGNGLRLRATPGVAGDLWFCAGIVQGGSHPTNTSLLKHATGCNTANPAVFSSIANVTEPRHIGFGKAKPGGGGYPAIFMDGWVSNVYGVWQSDDGGATWTSLGSSPLNSADSITAVSGDMNTYGTCYIGFSGTGGAYYN